MKYFPKKLTMTWISNSYKEGSLTPEELAGEIVRRAEKYRDYNIWIVAPDLKRMMDYIEKLPKDMESLPLWGIPFAVKDNIDVAGSPTTAACPDYAYDPKEDAAVVKTDRGRCISGRENQLRPVCNRPCRNKKPLWRSKKRT